METPYQIGHRLFQAGHGISSLWGAVKLDEEMDEAQRGYDDAQKGIKMETNNNEVMDILQEEAAEVIQAVSKIRRFGADNAKHGTEQTNVQHLEEELGDMLAMIDILMINNVVSWGNLHAAKRAKIEKLKKWSNIPNLENI